MVAAPLVGVNGAAGLPTCVSWWNASSSAFLMIASWVEFNLESYGIDVSVKHDIVRGLAVAYVGAQKNGAFQEYPGCEVRPLLLDRQIAVSDFHHVPILPLVCPVQPH